MNSDFPFIPGTTTTKYAPLLRFLPPIPEGIAKLWIEKYLHEIKGKTSQSNPWIIDPFGISPQTVTEIARCGYQVFVAANNPINRFLIEYSAQPSTSEELRVALAELAKSYKGEQRLEPHIRELYQSTCLKCNQIVDVESFLWDRDEQIPFAKIYTCPSCGDSGERPTNIDDKKRAEEFSANRLHRARAIERIAGRDDPDRTLVEEAIDVYLPRSLYAIITIINKIPGLLHYKKELSAILLYGFDFANSLWHHPTQRTRPRQLAIPPRFRENNIWLALEEAVNFWSKETNRENIPVTYWPKLPPETGGICIFEGRFRDIFQKISTISLPMKTGVLDRIISNLDAIVTAIPRPNQAFWYLCTLWAGWIWGKSEAESFKSVLRRRRFDWGWHCTALKSIFTELSDRILPGTPAFLISGETEPGLLSSVTLSAGLSGFSIENIAFRIEDSQVQILMKKRETIGQPIFKKDFSLLSEVIRTASLKFIYDRMEPVNYLHIQTASLKAIIDQQCFPDWAGSDPANILAQIQSTLQHVFTSEQHFQRFNKSEHSLDVGLWWLSDSQFASFQEANKCKIFLPFADRVEKSIINYLVENPGTSYSELDSALCNQFRGLSTPPTSLIQACLNSYTEPTSQFDNKLLLRQEDLPQNRRVELIEIRNILTNLGKQLGFICNEVGNKESNDKTPLLWYSSSGILLYVFYFLTSSCIYPIIISSSYQPSKCVLVIPGSRISLLEFKINNNPCLYLTLTRGWRILKFRHVRRLASETHLISSNLDTMLQLDPAIKSGTTSLLF